MEQSAGDPFVEGVRGAIHDRRENAAVVAGRRAPSLHAFHGALVFGKYVPPERLVRLPCCIEFLFADSLVEIENFEPLARSG